MNLIKKLPYSLHDENILKEDISDIKKYLKLCKDGIPNVSKLESSFSNLCFDKEDAMSKKDYIIQLGLLKDYIVAKYKFYYRNLIIVISIAN